MRVAVGPTSVVTSTRRRRHCAEIAEDRKTRDDVQLIIGLRAGASATSAINTSPNVAASLSRLQMGRGKQLSHKPLTRPNNSDTT